MIKDSEVFYQWDTDRLSNMSIGHSLLIMTSSNWNIFRVTGHLCGEFTGPKGQWRGALMFSLISVMDSMIDPIDKILVR